MDVVRENSNAIAEGVLQVPSVAHETVLQVKKVNWKDESSFPEEKADIILGSDLVYDIKILDLLVPALKNMLTTDGEILYVAPDTGRDGMAELVARLAQVNLFLIESAPVPERLYANPLVGDDEDQFILHFYDLSAKQPHTFYRFAFGSSVDQPASTSEVVA